MHTNHTLDIFNTATMTIGSRLCHFASVTCNAFTTKELWWEIAAHQHHALKRNASRGSSALPTPSEQLSSALPKKFNINTIKNHSLRNYPDQIRRFGTTDSYLTEPVCSSLMHTIYLCFILKTSLHSVSWNTGSLSLDTSALTRKTLQNNSLKLSATKCTYDKSMPSCQIANDHINLDCVRWLKNQ